MLWSWNLIRTCFALVVLTFFSACSDYVGQIDEQIDEYNAHEAAREESLVQIADFYVVPTSAFGGTFTDSRDGQVYKTVTIGLQTWMAENLNYEAPESYCYNDEKSYCDTYGRLYTWAAAMDSAGKWSGDAKGCGNEKICAPAYPVRGVCPEGWHLPSMGEWNTLNSAIGNVFSGGCGTSEKEGPCSLNTDDEYGFDIRLAGGRLESGKYYKEKSETYFWSSTESDKQYADIYKWYRNRLEENGGFKPEGMSVRCVKDVTDERPGKSSVETVPFTDERDGKTYETVTIGDQVWMAENLNYDDSVSRCYDDKDSYCVKYGRLYQWNTAMVACPAGWHLPTRAEFETLFAAVGGGATAGKMLKSYSGWKGDGNGLDTYGFSALPGGGVFDSGDVNEDETAYFWSATEPSSEDYEAAYVFMSYDKRATNVIYTDKEHELSVRCVKD